MTCHRCEKLERALRDLVRVMSHQLARGEDPEEGAFDRAWVAACAALSDEEPAAPFKLATVAQQFPSGVLVGANRPAEEPAPTVPPAYKCGCEKGHRFLDDCPEVHLPPDPDHFPDPAPSAEPPCGGSRCFQGPGGEWIHSSKSYGSCAVRGEGGHG